MPVLPIRYADAKHPTLLSLSGGFNGDVNDLMRRKLITYKDAESVTLYSPAVYLLSKPKKIFISHSETGHGVDLIKMVATSLKSVAITVFSSDPQSRAFMSRSVVDIASWEEKQMEESDKVVVVLTKSYCEKVDRDGDSGCKREWLWVKRCLEQRADDPKIILTYVSPFEENVIGSVKDSVGRRSLLRASTDDLGSIFMRVTL